MNLTSVFYHIAFVMRRNACFFNGYKHASSNDTFYAEKKKHALFMLGFHIDICDVSSALSFFLLISCIYPPPTLMFLS